MRLAAADRHAGRASALFNYGFCARKRPALRTGDRDCFLDSDLQLVWRSDLIGPRAKIGEQSGGHHTRGTAAHLDNWPFDASHRRIRGIASAAWGRAAG